MHSYLRRLRAVRLVVIFDAHECSCLAATARAKRDSCRGTGMRYPFVRGWPCPFLKLQTFDRKSWSDEKTWLDWLCKLRVLRKTSKGLNIKPLPRAKAAY